MNYPSRYRRARKLSGLSAANAAIRLDFRSGYLALLEKGAIDPTEEDLRLMSDCYGLPLAYLQGAPLKVPEALSKLLRHADISEHDRDELIEFFGIIGSSGPETA